MVRPAVRVAPLDEPFKHRIVLSWARLRDIGVGLTQDSCLARGASARSALLLVSAGALLGDVAEETLAGAGLSSRDWTVLSILDADGPGSQQELARLMGKAPAVVVSAVDALEDRGLVARSRDPADRRRSRVTMTPAGATALARGDELADEAVAELFSGLDADELRLLHDLLARGLAPKVDARPTPPTPAAA